MNIKPWQYYDPEFEYEKLFQDTEWPWAGHKRFIYDFVRNIKPKHIVELGTHKGTSFFSMCQAVKDGGLSTRLSAADTWKGDPHAGFYDESVYKDVQKIAQTYYQSLNVDLIRKSFDEAVTDYKKSVIDLLHIDGMHTYEAVKHDFETWISKLKPNGVIVFHDTNEKRNDFGVYKLWEELKFRYSTFDFYHSHGLGVMMLGPQLNRIKVYSSIWQRYYDIYHKYDLVSYENKKLLINIQSQTQTIESQLNYIKYQDRQIYLRDKIATAQSHIDQLEGELKTLKSAKFFRLWQGYNSLKRIFS